MTDAVLGAKARGLLAHIFNEFRPLNTIGKAGKIFHRRGQRQLSPRFMAFDHERLEVGAGVVEGGGVAGTSGAHDHDIAYIHSGDYLDSERQISLQACRWSVGLSRPATPMPTGVTPVSPPELRGFLCARRLLGCSPDAQTSQVLRYQFARAQSGAIAPPNRGGGGGDGPVRPFVL